MALNHQANVKECVAMKANVSAGKKLKLKIQQTIAYRDMHQMYGAGPAPTGAFQT